MCGHDWCTISSTDAIFFLCNRFKGHSMLAPFTAGWQSTDLHPLVIERSEVLHSSILLIFFSLLQCSTKIFGK